MFIYVQNANAGAGDRPFCMLADIGNFYNLTTRDPTQNVDIDNHSCGSSYA